MHADWIVLAAGVAFVAKGFVGGRFLVRGISEPLDEKSSRKAFFVLGGSLLLVGAVELACSAAAK